MIYCDSSFLVALFFDVDRHSVKAQELARSFDIGIPYTWLARLELLNTVYRLLGTKTVQLSKTLSTINHAQSAGILAACQLDHDRLVQVAFDLIKRHTGTHKCHTLDILHVAAALQVGANTFASFENRQRALATGIKLKVLP